MGLLRHGQVITGEAYYYEKRLYHGDVTGYIDGDDFNTMPQAFLQEVAKC